jgi:hypothetical protein
MSQSGDSTMLVSLVILAPYQTNATSKSFNTCIFPYHYQAQMQHLHPLLWFKTLTIIPPSYLCWMLLEPYLQITSVIMKVAMASSTVADLPTLFSIS